jgi:hypothetical protein
VVAADGYEPFVTDAPLKPDHTVKRSSGQRLQRGPLLAEVLGDHTMRGAMQANVGDRVEPLAQLTVHVSEILEAMCQEEVLPDVPVGAFDHALGLGAISLARTWSKAVVLPKRDQLHVVDDVLLELSEHRGLHPVVENLARHPAQMFERFQVTAQHRLQVLMLNESASQVPAVSKDNREQPDRASLARCVVEFNVEVCEVNLRLMAGGGLEAHFEAALARRPNHWREPGFPSARTDGVMAL